MGDRSGSLADFLIEGLDMYGGAGPRAVPGPIASDGSFTVTWRAS